MAILRHFFKAIQAVALLVCNVRSVEKNPSGNQNLNKCCIWKVNSKQMCWPVGGGCKAGSRCSEKGSMGIQHKSEAGVHAEGLQRSTFHFHHDKLHHKTDRPTSSDFYD